MFMCRGRKPKEWSDETVQVIKENYPVLSNGQLAQMLGISKTQVSRMGRKLGLSKTNKYWKLTPQMKEAILELYSTCSYKSIGDKLHVSISFVSKTVMSAAAEDPTFRKRSKEEVGKLISECRKKLLKSERSHVVFGLEQESRIKIFRSEPKNKMRRRLRLCGAYEIDYGGMDVYITDERLRSQPLELAAESIGFDFFAAVGEADTEGLVEYQQIRIRKSDTNGKNEQ